MKKKSYVMKKNSKDDTNEFVDFVAANIPKEIQKGIMYPDTTSKRYSFRFNNYRRAIKFPLYKEISFEKLQRKLRTNPYHFKWKSYNQNKKISIENIKPQISMLISKNTIIAIWKQNIVNKEKEVFVVEGETDEQISGWLDNKKEEIQKQLDETLKWFFDILGIKISSFKPYNQRKEIEIKGDSFIDQLPKHLIIHDTVGKKVYEKGFEFNDESYVKNYIKNRSLEELSPKITEQLLLIDKKIDLLDKRQELQQEAMEYYNKNIVKHFEVLNKMSRALDKMNNKLSQRNLNEWLRC